MFSSLLKLLTVISLLVWLCYISKYPSNQTIRIHGFLTRQTIMLCALFVEDFTTIRQVSGELTTTNSLSLLLKRDGDDQDSTAFDEIVLPERTHHCLLQAIAGTTQNGCHCLIVNEHFSIARGGAILHSQTLSLQVTYWLVFISRHLSSLIDNHPVEKVSGYVRTGERPYASLKWFSLLVKF